MLLRLIRRLRGRVSGWYRRQARHTDVIFAVLQRYRGSVTVFYLALLIAIGCARLLPPELGRNPYLGPVMLRLGHARTLSLPLLFLLGTGLHALFVFARHLLMLRLVAVAALLFAAAELVGTFDKTFPAAPRALLGLLAVPAVLVFVALRGSLARVRRLLSVVLLLGFLGVLPVLLGRAASEDGPSRASQMAYFGSLTAIWALGLVAWTTRVVPSPHRHAVRLPAVSGRRVPLGGARTLALVLLLPPYLSLDLASSVSAGDATLDAARRMMIRSEVFTLFDKRLSETAAGIPFEGDGRQIVPGLGNLKAVATCDAMCSFIVQLDSFTDTESFNFTFNGRDLSRGLLGARIVLARLAIENGVRLSGDATSRDLYFALKDRVESRTVTLPVADVQLNAPTARWALAVVVIAILILLRNRIGLALGDGGASDDDPWLLLDPMDALERLVAAGYLLLIAGTSSIVAGALIFTAESAVQAGAVLVFWMLGFALSFSVIHRLLILRARRRSGRRARRRKSRSSPTTIAPAGQQQG